MGLDTRRSRALLLVWMLALCAGTAVAQDPTGTQSGDDARWMVFVGGFFPDVDSELRLHDPDLGLAPPLDFEDLGLEAEPTTLRLGAAVRLSRNGRHLLEIEYLKIDRDGPLTLDEDLEFGGSVFAVAGDVDGGVNTEDLDIHYIYNVLKSDRGWLGLAIGVHALRLEARAEGTVTVSGGVVVEASGVERFADDFPLPLVGLRAGYELARNLQLTAGFKWLSANVDDIDGSFTDSWVRLEYRVARPLSVGVGLARIDADYERELDLSKREVIEASYEYSGVEAFIRLLF